MQIRKVALTLALASATGLAFTESASAQLGTYTPILTWGGPTFVKFIGYSAALRSEAWFFGTVNPGPDQNPLVNGYTGQYMFANQAPANSQAPGSGGAAPLAPKTSWNQLSGSWAQNTQLVFGLWVRDILTDGTDMWFYTGDPTFNIDARIHAKVTQLGKYHYAVGFEDLCARANPDPGLDCTNARYSVDWDYNDHIFEVYSTPEPVSLSLLGTGLLGLAGLSRRRRKQRQN